MIVIHESLDVIFVSQTIVVMQLFDGVLSVENLLSVPLLDAEVRLSRGFGLSFCVFYVGTDGQSLSVEPAGDTVAQHLRRLALVGARLALLPEILPELFVLEHVGCLDFELTRFVGG